MEFIVKWIAQTTTSQSQETNALINAARTQKTRALALHPVQTSSQMTEYIALQVAMRISYTIRSLGKHAQIPANTT